MNVTFIVGNGFDISLGMKTKYEDFYKYYCRLSSKTLQIERFKESIRNDIANGRTLWADFEAGLGKYTMDFSEETASEYISCLNDAQRHFAEYYTAVNSHFDPSIFLSNICRSRNKLLEFYKDLPDNEQKPFIQLIKANTDFDTVFKFLSLNYTTVLDKFVNLLSKEALTTWHGTQNRLHKAIVNPSVHHIHGRFDCFPIIGVGDESQILNRNLRNTLSDSMIKSRCVRALNYSWYDDTENYIAESTIICIYGTSLGKTDTYLWNKIVQWLLGSEERQVIVFWHTSTGPDNIVADLQLHYNKVVRQLLLSNSNISRRKKDMLTSQIHVVINTDTVLRI